MIGQGTEAHDTKQHVLPEHRDGLVPMPWRGVWPGTVVDTNDPERKRRIRVRVDQVYGEASATADNKIPDNRLPWAIPGYGIGGAESGDFVVPPVGAGVWVAFWMGDPEYPVWLGGWHGDGDIPDRFTSSYQGADGPCTRIWRTPTGHTFEMRWCDGEEEISVESAGGSKVRIVDATALGGPQIVAETAGQQKVELVDQPLPKVAVTTTGDFEVTAPGGKTTQTFALASALSFAAALALTVGGVLTLAVATIAFTGAVAVSTGLFPLTVTASVVNLVGAVTLGLVGAKYRLVDERFITSVQNPNATTFAGHTHQDSTGGQTGIPELPPGVPAVFVAAAAPAHTTSNTTAN